MVGSRRIVIAIGGVAAIGVGSAALPALADDRTGVTRTIDALDACRRIGVDVDRLTCFDRAAAAVIAARGKGDLIVLDREKVVERRRQRFGLASDSDPGINAAEVKELDTSVRAIVASRMPGRYDMELANNSVWQTVEPVRFPPKAGDAIKLKSALMGGYRATMDGRSVLVKRLR